MTGRESGGGKGRGGGKESSGGSPQRGGGRGGRGLGRGRGSPHKRGGSPYRMSPQRTPVRPRSGKNTETRMDGALLCHVIPGREDAPTDIRLNGRQLRDVDLPGWIQRLDEEIPRAAADVHASLSKFPLQKSKLRVDYPPKEVEDDDDDDDAQQAIQGDDEEEEEEHALLEEGVHKESPSFIGEEAESATIRTVEEKLERLSLEGAKRPPLSMSIFLSENQLTGSTLASLTEWVCGPTFQAHARLRNLYLFKNRLRDEHVGALCSLLERLAGLGRPLWELHLSHNRFSESAACQLLDAVKRCGSYPAGRRPLWLRLEYNYLDAEAVQAHAESLPLRWCAAKDRALCGPSQCRATSAADVPALHLYVLGAQYRAAKAEYVRQLRTRVQASAAAEDGKQCPLFVFLDTCAVLDMADERRQAQLGEHGFSFAEIVSRARDGRFGGQGGQEVRLVVCDTVMQELDHQKLQPRLRPVVLQLQSDRGWLQQAAELHILELLGAAEGENVVQYYDQQVTRPADDRRVDRNALNDRAIVDLALFWQAELALPQAVLFVSSDVGAVEIGRRHGLWSLSLRDVSARLRPLEDAWTSSWLRASLPALLTPSSTPSVVPARNQVAIRLALRDAEEVVGQLASTLRSLNPSSLDERTLVLLDSIPRLRSNWLNLLSSSSNSTL